MTITVPMMLLADHQTLPHTWLPELIIAAIIALVSSFLGAFVWERALFNENQKLGRVARAFVVVGVTALIFAALLAVFPINTHNGRTHCGTALFPEGELCGDARVSIQVMMVALAGLGTVLLAAALAMTPRRYG